MPAQERDIDTVLEEGVKLEPLVSPVRILTEGGRLTGIECIKNRLSDVDASGRRKPVPIPGTEHVIPLDTLIVTIGDVPDIEFITSMGVDVNKWGTMKVDNRTLATSRPGVFAGGDVVSGPNTVVEAIAAGKRAALMIRRYLNGEELEQPCSAVRPEAFVEPLAIDEEELETAKRTDPPVIPVAARRKNYSEIEQSFTVEEATKEARRCLRCDLEFTQPKEDETATPAVVGEKA
jgi:NADPH-dependent glutamate synthase beta subunit-like oxidoreductase